MRKIGWFLFISLALFNVIFSIYTFSPAGTLFGPKKDMVKGIDFLMRRNEARCVLDGIDPYLLWEQKVVKEPYYPYVKFDLRTENVYEPINAYTPWEYPFAMIWAVLPKQISWLCYFTLMLLAFAGVIVFAFRIGGVWAAVAASSFIVPAGVDISVGNYGLIITATIIGMCVFLDKGWKIGASCCWVIAMFKPQLALLLTIPLILKKQWLVGVITALCCVTLMLPSVILCNISPLTLVREAPAASMHAFSGCALMPEPLLKCLEQFATAEVWMSCSMVVGLGLCCFLTYWVRKSKSWLVLILPSLICSVSWTYVHPHSYVVLIPVAAYLVYDIVSNQTVGRYIIGCTTIMMMARFPHGAEIICRRICPSLFTFSQTLMLWTASIALVLFVVYVLLYLPSKEDSIKEK